MGNQQALQQPQSAQALGSNKHVLRSSLYCASFLPMSNSWLVKPQKSSLYSKRVSLRTVQNHRGKKTPVIMSHFNEMSSSDNSQVDPSLSQSLQNNVKSNPQMLEVHQEPKIEIKPLDPGIIKKTAHYRSYVDIVQLRRDQMVKQTLDLGSQSYMNNIKQNMEKEKQTLPVYEKPAESFVRSLFLTGYEKKIRSLKLQLQDQFQEIRNIQKDIELVKYGSQSGGAQQQNDKFYNLAQKYTDLEIQTKKFNEIKILLDQQENLELDAEQADKEIQVYINRYPGWGREVQTFIGPNNQMVSERVATSEDYLEAAHYLNFLTAQYQIDKDLAKTSPNDANLHEKVTALFRQYDLNEDFKSNKTKTVTNMEDDKPSNETNLENEFATYKIKLEQESQNQKVVERSYAEKMLNLNTAWESIQSETQPKELNDQLNLELKKRDLIQKYQVKNSLNQIFKNAEDNRSNNWEQYFLKLSKIQGQYIGQDSQTENLKSFIEKQDQLSTEEKNKIFSLHNTASDDSVYAMRLVNFTRHLKKEGKLSEQDDYRILLYSIDWPVDIQIDLVM